MEKKTNVCGFHRHRHRRRPGYMAVKTRTQYAHIYIGTYIIRVYGFIYYYVL